MKESALSEFSCFRGKQIAHGFNRNEDAGVGAVVAVFSDLGQHSDHVKADTVQQHSCAHSRTSGENIL